ncbi:hypothetical protein [Burkholderia ambifaria]|uniref:hypothetical protein n=1 Tax=Burkholderia ambifaria TaxID=152480 RepID=UPI001ABBE192|nr:hypothetical protein [Burkholderia ambifaria]
MVVRKGEGDRFTVALAAANGWPFAGEGDRLTVALAMANRWPFAAEGDWLTVAQAAANRPRVTAGSRSR